MVVGLLLSQGGDVGECAQCAFQNRLCVFLVGSGLSSVRHALFLEIISGGAICSFPLLPSCIERGQSLSLLYVILPEGSPAGGIGDILCRGGKMFLETNGRPQTDRCCAWSLGSAKCKLGTGVDDGAGGEGEHGGVD